MSRLISILIKICMNNSNLCFLRWKVYCLFEGGIATRNIDQFRYKCRYKSVKCRISFNKKVLESRMKEVSSDLKTTTGLSKTEKEVLKLLLENSNITTEDISKEVGITKRTIERSLVALQKKGKIERIGSKKAGKWSVIQ